MRTHLHEGHGVKLLYGLSGKRHWEVRSRNGELDEEFKTFHGGTAS